MTTGPAHPDHLVAFDLETTGLSPRSDRILEIGAVRYDEHLQRIDQLQLIVDPQIPIPLAIQRLVGLTDADVQGAPPPLEAATQLAAFCGDAALIAHGGTFDLLFLRLLLTESFAARLIYDTLDLARILLPTFESHSLPLLSRRLGIAHERPHRALSDALATGDLFRMLVGAGRALPDSTLGEMRRVATQAPGPLAEFLNDVMRRRGVEVDGPPAPAPPMPTPLASGPDRQSTPSLAERNVGDAAAMLLGPEGPLAGREGYEYRDAQLQMAVAIGQTLERKRRLMVEAGTGVGKSLAYLTPLAIWAQRTGKRAVVATHTVNLQEQLADRDLPTVAGLLDQPVPVAVLKGRNHYISLRRWQRFLDTPDLTSSRPGPGGDSLQAEDPRVARHNLDGRPVRGVSLRRGGATLAPDRIGGQRLSRTCMCELGKRALSHGERAARRRRCCHCCHQPRAAARGQRESGADSRSVRRVGHR